MNKWEDKKEHHNMVNVEPRENQKKDDEVGVRVITQANAKKRMDFESMVSKDGGEYNKGRISPF